MFFVLDAYWLPVLLALLIGLLTGLWIWRGRNRTERVSPFADVEQEAPREIVPGSAYYKKPDRPRSVEVAPPAGAPPPGTGAEPATEMFSGAAKPRQTIAAEPTSHHPAEPPAPPSAPAVRHHEGDGVADAGAAAVEDIADEFLGIDAHPAGTPDDLTRMKGVGPKLASLLNEAGVTRYDQIAGWSDEELDAMDARMGSFRGRLRRDRVVEQARFLARGDQAGYEAVFGKLGG